MVNEDVFFWFNQWVGQYELLDDALRFAQVSHIKSVPFMLAVWAIWFLPNTLSERTRIRESLCAALFCTVPIIVVTRALANYMPFNLRPIHTTGLEINLLSDYSAVFLDGWSSWPSDHASLFIGFSVAIFVIHRVFGIVLLAWAIFVVLLPRIVMGLHWPSDILVGAIIGASGALLLISPLTRLVRNLGLVRFFEAREAFGYPLLFLLTYEVAQMFALTRYIVNGAIN